MSLSAVLDAAPTADVDQLLAASAWRTTFPPADFVGSAAAELRAASGFVRHDGARIPEGPRAFAVISPGSFRLTRCDLARRERTEQRQAGIRIKTVDLSASIQLGNGAKALARGLVAAGLSHDVVAPDERDPLLPGTPVREVVEWSPKSRSNMVRRLLTLDYHPLLEQGTIAMVTLTLPGDWETVAPNGKAFKRLIRAWQRRYLRAWGQPIWGAWKLEFQRRGAPHLHIMTVPPPGLSEREGMPFREWLSWSWASVVDHPDPEQKRRHLLAGTAVDYREGLRCTDPQRVAIYFTKHGTMSNKEYQHIVPELWRGAGDGPGRFWGVWGLSPVEFIVELTHDQAIALGRTARRWFRAKGAVHVVSRWRTNMRTGVMRKRTMREPLSRLPRTWGFMSVEDGPTLAMMLSRVIQ